MQNGLQKDSKHGRYSTVFKVDYKNFKHHSSTWGLTTYDRHFNTHTHTLTGLHLDRRRSALNVLLFESSLNFLQLQQDLYARLGGMTCELLGRHWVSMETVSMVTGHLLVKDNGLAKGTAGHESVLEWAWVWGRLTGSFFLFFLSFCFFVFL